MITQRTAHSLLTHRAGRTVQKSALRARCAAVYETSSGAARISAASESGRCRAAEATAPLAAPLDAPTDSSSSFLERQQLAEALEEQMSGVEAVEVSK